MDVLCVNHYYGWYSDTGHTEVIKAQMTLDLTSWHAKFKKPVIVTEYGADTVAGLHQVCDSNIYIIMGKSDSDRVWRRHSGRSPPGM